MMSPDWRCSISSRVWSVDLFYPARGLTTTSLRIAELRLRTFVLFQLQNWISAESGWRIVPVYPLAPLPVAPGICLFNRLASLDPSQSQGFGPLPLTAPRVAWVSETYAYSLGQKLLKTMAIKAAAAGGGPAKRAFFCERDGHQSRRGRRMSFMISVHPFFPLIPHFCLQSYHKKEGRAYPAP